METLEISSGENQVRFAINGSEIFKKIERHNYNYLATIEKLISMNKIGLDHIDNISLQIAKDDSFTTKRALTTIANALAFSLSIPVNNQAFVKIQYQKEPNITLKK